MTFRILDLICLTTIVGILAGMFRYDLAFFRQLSFFASAAFGSTIFVLSIRTKFVGDRARGAMGGLLATLFLISVAYFLRQSLFDIDDGELTIWSVSVEYSIVAWFGESIIALLIAIPLGSALGPLIAIRFRQVEIPPENIRRFWISIVLLVSIFLFGWMATDDRVSMQQPDRNWIPVFAISMVAFVIHTFIWIGKTPSSPQQLETQRSAD